ncbi:MAG: bifunctional UDP-N-acetylmuramoyl-tripeptide:D-alanyl-D-alanine ligase/alanine racemase, partial [Bacteroidia bacterium]|nr:bifunctional UDP-N-acetylmuramoyl-tripeptide:D-alanyl-D-alanine ligase/alanine racemase [Bacteroidia bacterium]
MYTIADITKIVGGILEGNSETPIEFICTDSRKIQYPNASIFIALKTSKSDGHNYLKQATKQGVAALIVSENISSEIPYIKVSDTLEALQKLATHHRNEFSVPVIGITGSNGKTIVKEWISYLLQDTFAICKSPKSYNSQIGVPLSVWSMNKKHTLGVFEAGISQAGEMEKLARIIQPSIGVFTHFGDAHDSGFKSRKEKLQEKAKLFSSCETVVCSDSNKLAIKEFSKMPVNLFTWGSSVASKLHVFKNTDQTFTLTYQGNSSSVSLPYNDKASLDNAFSSIATCLVVGISLETILGKLDHMPVIDMRLQQVYGLNNNHLVLDYYNSDFQSIVIALDFLKQQHSKTKTTVILSDILQSNLPPEELYGKVNKLLKNNDIDEFIGIGPSIQQHANKFDLDSAFYQTTEEFLNKYPFHQLKNQTILLKGARLF